MGQTVSCERNESPCGTKAIMGSQVIEPQPDERRGEMMEWLNWKWFNISSPMWVHVFGIRWPYTIRLWNLFNRYPSTGEHWWGVGILQLGQRHLFYIGDGGFCFLFIGKNP
jgi:hypothetical protein